MKRYLLFIAFFLTAFICKDVYACGEIKELTSSVGTVTTVNSSSYLITIPEGTTEVTLVATTDYTWVDGYGPRVVSTFETAELRVDGNACGYGIYTYFINFKTFSNIIAETTPVETTPTEPTPDASTNTTDTTVPPATVETGLKLSKLVITGYTIDFDPNIYEYSLDVDSDTSFLPIEMETTDPTIITSVSDSAYSLVDGLNVITITLMDNLGNQTKYTLNVNRVQIKSSNNYLANITISGYQLNFDPSVTTYNLSIKKESMLNINATTESELSTYQVLGNNNLSDGSTIIIRVTAEDETTRDYTINITREFNIMDYWIYIVIVLLVILLILLLLITKNKKKKKKMGPDSLAAPKETAGVIQEIAPQNAQPPETTPAQPVATVAANTSATLQIIEPTNIEVAETPTDVDSANENSPTEIFQL